MNRNTTLFTVAIFATLAACEEVEPSEIVYITVEGDSEVTTIVNVNYTEDDSDSDIDSDTDVDTDSDSEPVDMWCEPWTVHSGAETIDGVEVASKPVVNFSSTATGLPNDRTYFSMSGGIYTAGSCGEGVVLNDVAINITGIPLGVNLTTAEAVLSFDGFTTYISCLPVYNEYTDTNEYWCVAYDLAEDPISYLEVLPNSNGEAFNLMVRDFPTFDFVEVSEMDHPIEVTMYAHWTDIATGEGYQRHGWPVVDSDSFDLEVYYNHCSSSERRFADLDHDGHTDPDNYVLVSVCEPYTEDYPHAWEAGDGTDCDDTDPSITDECHQVSDCDGDPGVILNALSPGGTSISPIWQTAMLFDLDVPSCTDMKVTGIHYELTLTDHTESGWRQSVGYTVADMNDDPLWDIGAGLMNAELMPTGYWSVEPHVIPAGSTHTLEVSLDFSGASTWADDTALVTITGIDWVDDEGNTHVNDQLPGLPLSGRVLYF